MLFQFYSYNFVFLFLVLENSVTGSSSFYLYEPEIDNSLQKIFDNRPKMNAVIESGYQICLRGLWAYRLIRVDYEKIFLDYPAVAICLIHMVGSGGESRISHGRLKAGSHFIFKPSYEQPQL